MVALILSAPASSGAWSTRFGDRPEINQPCRASGTFLRMTNHLPVLGFRRRLRGMGEYGGLGVFFGGVLAGLAGWALLWPMLACGIVFGVAGFRQGPTPPLKEKSDTLVGVVRRLR